MVTRKISPYVFPGLDLRSDSVDTYAFISRVADKFHTNVSTLFSPTREQKVVEVRQCVWHVLYTHEKKNYSALGRYFSRDHATVLYGVKKVHSMLRIGDQQISTIHKDVLSIYKILKDGEAKND